VSDQAEHLRRLVESGDDPAESDFANGGAAAAVLDRHARSATRRISFSPHRAHSPLPQGEGSGVRDSLLHGLQPPRFARAIAISSGKGGVGKSNIAVNLCVAFAALGKNVCLIDADLGLANSDVLCNLSPRFTLDDVAHGSCALGDALLAAPGGFRILPGAAGVARMADLPPAKHAQILSRLTVLERAMDYLIIDTGAGLSRGVLSFAASAHTLLVTATPEPTSLTDAYGLIKSVARLSDETRIEVVMNMARTESEARDAFRRLDKVSRTFIGRPLRLAGVILFDDAVRQAVHQRTPITLLAPQGRTSRAIVRIAHGILESERRQRTAAGEENPSSSGFIARLRRWVGRG